MSHTDAECRLLDWCRAIRDLTNGGSGDVVTLRTDGASFRTMFWLIDQIDAEIHASSGISHDSTESP